MSLIPGITAVGPIIGQELDGDTFKVVAGQYQPKFDPASTNTITITAAGIKVNAPAAVPTTHTATYDAIGKNLTTVVNGVTAVTSLAALDDEATELAFSAGTLQIKNAAGTVLSSTPIPDLDAQQLSIAGNTISLTGGGSVTLPAVAAPTVSNTVTGTGAARTISTTVSGVTGAAVPIPDTEAQTLSLTGQTLAISGGNSVTLPALPTGAATLSPTGLLTMGGQTLQLVRPTSSLGTPLGFWAVPV